MNHNFNLDDILSQINTDKLYISFGTIININSSNIIASGLDVAIGDVVKIESIKHLYNKDFL